MLDTQEQSARVKKLLWVLWGKLIEGNILHCTKRTQNKIRISQWRLLERKEKFLTHFFLPLLHNFHSLHYHFLVLVSFLFPLSFVLNYKAKLLVHAALNLSPFSLRSNLALFELVSLTNIFLFFYFFSFLAHKKHWKSIFGASPNRWSKYATNLPLYRVRWNSHRLNVIP